MGTDPGQFTVLRPYVITGPLASHLPPPYTDQKFIQTGALYLFAQQEVLVRSLASLKLTEEQSIALHGYREQFPLASPKQVGVLQSSAAGDGVWATPPFLHNGSVPNLYEMLLPAEKRTKKFYIGREFDPIKVGLDTERKARTLPCWTRHCPEIRMPATPSLRMALSGTASSAHC